MDLRHAGGKTTRATFITFEALPSDLELISQGDSSCLPANVRCRTQCSGGQIAMTDSTRDIKCVFLWSCALPLNNKHALFPQGDRHGKPNQRLSFKKSPGFYVLRWQPVWSVYIWCLSIFSIGMNWFTFPGSGGYWFASINSYNCGMSRSLALDASIRNFNRVLFLFCAKKPPLICSKTIFLLRSDLGVDCVEIKHSQIWSIDCEVFWCPRDLIWTFAKVVLEASFCRAIFIVYANLGNRKPKSVYSGLTSPPFSLTCFGCCKGHS